MTNLLQKEIEVVVLWLTFLVTLAMRDVFAVPPAPVPGPAGLILGNTSVWRCCFVHRKPVVSTFSAATPRATGGNFTWVTRRPTCWPRAQGALATVCFEMIRQGAQDLEARIFLEKALLDPDLRAKLGDGLAQRCQQLLDDRVRAVLTGRTSWLLLSSGQARLEKLYALAAEAAGKLGPQSPP